MQINYRGPYSSWHDALKICTGYDSNKILASVLNTTRKVIKGEYLYERDSVGFKKKCYEWQMCTALLSSLNSNSGKLCIVDFGGSLGSRYFQHKELLEPYNIDWNIIEQKHYVEATSDIVKIDNLSFHSSIDDFKKHKNADFIILSSVLQYLRDPQRIIEELINLNPQSFFIDRTYVTSKSTSDLIYTQNSSINGLDYSYPFHLFAEKTIFNMFDDFKHIYDFNANYPPTELASINARLKGYLFNKN